MRGGAEVARWAHNPKVVGSNPAPATKAKTSHVCVRFFFMPLLAKACFQASRGIKKTQAEGLRGFCFMSPPFSGSTRAAS